MTAAREDLELKLTNVLRFKSTPSHFDTYWHRWYTLVLNLFFFAHNGKHAVRAHLTEWFLSWNLCSKPTYAWSNFRALEMSSERTAKSEQERVSVLFWGERKKAEGWGLWSRYRRREQKRRPALRTAADLDMQRLHFQFNFTETMLIIRDPHAFRK